MLEPEQVFKKLNSSKEFCDFKKKNKDSFLVACFLIVEGGNWQLDYYDKKTELITSFEVSDNIKITPADKVFKQQGTKILELDIKKAKVNFSKALELAKRFVEKQYAGDKSFTKTIVILQNLKGKVVWNFTFLTSTLKMINLKLDAVSGEVVFHCEESFLSMK